MRIRSSLFSLLILCLPFVTWGQQLSHVVQIDSASDVYTNISPSVYVWVDSTNTASFSDAQKKLKIGLDSSQNYFANFVPLPQYKGKLDLPHAYWGYFSIQNMTGQDRNFHLGIYADYTDLYIGQAGQEYEHYPMGRFRSSRDMRDKAHRYGVELLIMDGAVVNVFFKNVSINHYEVFMKPNLRDSIFFQKRISEHNGYQGFFHGILWIMLLYNLLTFFSSRDKSYLYYVGYLLCGSTYFLYLYGYLNDFLTHPIPQLESYLWMLAVYGSTLFYAFFTRSYFHTKENIPKADRVIIWWVRIELLMLAVVLGIIAWNHNIALVRSINLGVTLVGTVVSLWVVWQLRVIKSRIFTLYVVGALTYLCAVVVFFYGLTLANWGWIGEVSGLTMSYIVEAGLVTEILCFSMGLSYRLKTHEEAKRVAQEALIEQLEAYRVFQAEANRALEEKVIERTSEIEIQKEEIAAQKENMQLQKEKLEVQFLELSELDEEKNHLMGVLAHDLRNPLTSLLTVVNVLKSEQEFMTEDHIECVDLLLRSLNRMEEMIHRTLDARAIEAKKTIVNLVPVNLCDTVQYVAQGFMAQAKEKNIILNYQAHSTGELWATIDKQYFTQVVENLISNALKYSPQHKQVWVSLHGADGKAMLAVRDQGPGISESDKLKLFHKFQKLSAQPTGGESSTGLGLSIVKKYVDLMQGEVWCESPEMGGCLFWVAFSELNLGAQKKIIE